MCRFSQFFVLILLLPKLGLRFVQLLLRTRFICGDRPFTFFDFFFETLDFVYMTFDFDSLVRKLPFSFGQIHADRFHFVQHLVDKDIKLLSLRLQIRCRGANRFQAFSAYLFWLLDIHTHFAEPLKKNKKRKTPLTRTSSTERNPP